MSSAIKVFDYIPEVDAFLCTSLFEEIVGTLGLGEWTPCVWICRYFCLDNDYGEHIFDNHDERDELKEKAQRAGVDSDELLIIIPDKFQNGSDGPCHSDAMRKRFWTDVCKYLHLDLDTIIEEAKEHHEKYPERWHNFNLEERIEKVRQIVNTHHSYVEK